MKLRKLQAELRDAGLDAAFFFKNDPNISYFAEFESDFSALVVPARSKPILLLTKFDTERAKGLRIRWEYFPDDLFKFLKKRFRFKKWGFDATKTSVKELRDFKRSLGGRWKDISAICRALRKIKTPQEIKIYKKACAETDKIFNQIIKNMAKFKTETDVARFIAHKAEIFEGLSFSPIIASADHASQPHYIPESHPLKKGFLMIDFGIKYKRYRTDMTRTVYLGTPKQQETELYNKVLAVQQKCIEMCRPGTALSKVQRWADSQLGSRFFHAIGHGIGIEIHEDPRFKSMEKGAAKEKLQQGMIVTIEPGLYLPGKLGIRIEDDVLITAKGPKTLSNASRRLITLKKP